MEKNIKVAYYSIGTSILIIPGPLAEMVKRFNLRSGSAPGAARSVRASKESGQGLNTGVGQKQIGS
ncbi:hypothetical protein ACI7RC_09890 [Brevibacillus sp. B_LB10_24]|uniref:hypothetical protein n=1 Tax=Brevibacillus sp. B_LB10_24 TaxID=3380645 RepID=UPI0038B7C71B